MPGLIANRFFEIKFPWSNLFYCFVLRSSFCWLFAGFNEEELLIDFLQAVVVIACWKNSYIQSPFRISFLIRLINTPPRLDNLGT